MLQLSWFTHTSKGELPLPVSNTGPHQSLLWTDEGDKPEKKKSFCRAVFCLLTPLAKFIAGSDKCQLNTGGRRRQVQSRTTRQPAARQSVCFVVVWTVLWAAWRDTNFPKYLWMWSSDLPKIIWGENEKGGGINSLAGELQFLSQVVVKKKDNS